MPVQIGRVDYLRGDTVERVLVRIDRHTRIRSSRISEFLDARGAIVARLGACRFRRVDLVGRRQNLPARFVYRLEVPLPGDVNAAGLPAPTRCSRMLSRGSMRRGTPAAGRSI